MKRTLMILALVGISALAALKILAGCASNFTSSGADTFDGGPCPQNFYKTAHWDIFHSNGHEWRDVKIREPGKCFSGFELPYMECFPGYDYPEWTTNTSTLAV
jgi:hypothetical protein